MKQTRLLFLWLASAALTGSLAQAPARQAAPDFIELEKIASEELRQLNTPGAAIGIVSGDRLIYAQGVGIADVETGTPVSPEMLFRLGSTTKMFTASALASLAEAGKIKLDEPIGRVTNGLHPAIAAVTAHQLLTHTSGILDEAPMYGSQDDGALGKEVRSWQEDRFFTTPGDIHSYSNPGFWLAGAVVEDLYGKPFADAMSELIFTPLGMKRTTLRPTMAMTYPLAQGHDAGAGGKPAVVRPAANNAASWPAGSIFSNVPDLSRFVIAFVNGGKLEGRQALSPELIMRLSTGYVEVPGTQPSQYGYGLNIRVDRGVRMVTHGGSRSGYGSLIWMAPEHHFGVIILANRTGASLSKTAEAAMAMFLPLAPEAPVEEKELPITEADKAAWPGAYVHPPAQRTEIVLKEGKLVLHRGNSELPIRKIGENQITAAPAGSRGGQRYIFVRGKDGKTMYLYAGGRASRKVATNVTDSH